MSFADLRIWLLPGALAVAGLGLGFVARRILLSRVARAAAATRTGVDDLVIGALRGPVVLWGATVGLYVAAETAALPRGVGSVVQKTLLTLVILSITWAVAQVTGALVRRSATSGASPLPSATLITNLVRFIIVTVGVLVVLQTLGISITPIITALGVGGLAVALALQDTLANLFAGIHILATRQIRPGDFVRLESGEEGYVQDITWRNTTILQLPNNLTIIPNAKLASAVVTNYYLPDTEMGFLTGVGVSYDSDLAKVERVAVDVGREVMREVEGGVSEFEPFIRYHAFGDSSIDFNVILRAREPVGQHLLRHEFVKRLHARFRAEGIEIPFPQRTLHMGSETADVLRGRRAR